MLLEFYRITPNGVEELYQTIRLTNATVAQFKQYSGKQGDLPRARAAMFEDISFVFQRIEIANLQAGTMAVDDR